MLADGPPWAELKGLLSFYELGSGLRVASICKGLALDSYGCIHAQFGPGLTRKSLRPVTDLAIAVRSRLVGSNC